MAPPRTDFSELFSAHREEVHGPGHPLGTDDLGLAGDQLRGVIPVDVAAEHGLHRVVLLQQGDEFPGVLILRVRIDIEVIPQLNGYPVGDIPHR